MGRKYNKSKYYLMIAGTFFLLYFVIMYFSTYMVKEDYRKDYEQHLIQQCSDLKGQFENDNSVVFDDVETDYDRVENAYFHHMISLYNKGLDQYQKMSIAIYDGEGRLTAQTGNLFGDFWHMYPVEDYFSEEELEKLIFYYEEAASIKERISIQDNMLIQCFYRDETEDLIGIYFQDFETGEIVWTWTKDGISQDDLKEYDNRASGFLFLPYLYLGREYWEAWQQDEWLQEFSDIEDGKRIEEREISNNEIIHHIEEKRGRLGGCYSIFVWEDETAFDLNSVESEAGPVQKYSIEVRHRIYPWLAAANYMKYIYLGGFLLVVSCMMAVLFAMRKLFLQQAELEQSRRDFTNAAAHELKTPLGIIRGFAENVKENTVEEKKDYYLEQIVSQTEVMDDLVREMIGISKLDNPANRQKGRKISVREVIEKEIKKLAPLIEEKSIVVETALQDDLYLSGDEMYIGKAFWNLLSNALEYNYMNGRVWVILNREECCIINTGKCIPEDELERVKEMFYTTDKSRHKRGGHTGLGLYLADRIFEMHGAAMRIENWESGVKVTVRKQN